MQEKMRRKKCALQLFLPYFLMLARVRHAPALGLLGARDRQLDEVTLVALGLLGDEVIIVIEGEGLL